MNALQVNRENLHIVTSANTSIESNQYGYQPITTGEIIPSFYLPTQHGITGLFASGVFSKDIFISLQDFLDYQQPLAIAFLGAPGQAAASIQQLEKLHDDIQEQGGRLLILTSIQPKYLRRQLKGANKLNLFYDADNTIAELFGLYDFQNPLWQWASGIEEDEESLPAIYVIAPDRTVAFTYVDYNFSLFTGDHYPLRAIRRELLEVVNEISAQYHYQPEAYKLVS